jgi:hypothetical protein
LVGERIEAEGEGERRRELDETDTDLAIFVSATVDRVRDVSRFPRGGDARAARDGKAAELKFAAESAVRLRTTMSSSS